MFRVRDPVRIPGKFVPCIATYIIQTPECDQVVQECSTERIPGESHQSRDRQEGFGYRTVCHFYFSHHWHTHHLSAIQFHEFT